MRAKGCLSKYDGGSINLMSALIYRDYNSDAMVGCMLESKLGIAASLVVANSVNNVKFTDLDGFTYLSQQPFTGGLKFENGIDELLGGKGLAVKPNGTFQL